MSQRLMFNSISNLKRTTFSHKFEKVKQINICVEITQMEYSWKESFCICSEIILQIDIKNQENDTFFFSDV